MFSFFFQALISSWVPMGGETGAAVGGTTVGVATAGAAGAVVGAVEVCAAVLNTGHNSLPSKCFHSPFPWTTVWKRSAKIAQFAPDTSSIGTEVGSTSNEFVDMFSLSSNRYFFQQFRGAGPIT
jgi:hypothetical protein